jgi:citrate lyase subunit beta/citryl-CoA lyase
MRTWLFVPGHDARKLHSALRSAADVVIIDWEDAVAEARKAEARKLTRAVLTSSPTRRCIVRVNNVQHPGFAADLAALRDLPIAGVMLPKVGAAAEVITAACETSVPIIPILESAQGIERAFEIAQAHPRIERLSFGPLDFLADMGAPWTPDNPAVQYARVRVALANRAAGLAGAIDGIYPRLDDRDGLRRDAAAARAVGYAGKMTIHPAQIAVVREAFSPTPEEIAQADAIMRAFEQAQARGEAAIRLDDAFIDPPVVRWAEQVLALRDADAAET